MNVKSQKTWVLIADGSRARILGSKGRLDNVSPVENHVYRNAHPRLREILSDKPGRTFDSVGSGRHAMAYSSDARREDERAFAVRLSSILEDALRQKAFDRLVIVAAPTTLGDLRTILPTTIREMVVAEVPKDLTHIPNSEIPAFLQDISPS